MSEADSLSGFIKEIEAALLKIRPIIAPISVAIPGMEAYFIGIAQCKSGLRLAVTCAGESGAIPLLEMNLPVRVACCSRETMKELHDLLTASQSGTIAKIDKAAKECAAFLSEILVKEE